MFGFHVLWEDIREMTHLDEVGHTSSEVFDSHLHNNLLL